MRPSSMFERVMIVAFRQQVLASLLASPRAVILEA
jgi:hypothetical protein